MKNATLAALLLVFISFTYLGCTPEETPVTEVQAPTPTQTVPPTIESFSPQSAFAGEQVTILGTGFGQLPIGIQVFFGDVEAQVVSASSTKIVVIVPEGAEEEKIQVKAEGGQAFTDEAFGLILPTIESFSPKSGFVGEQVTLTGTGFNQILPDIQVFFGDMEAQVISATSTKIVVVVPEGAPDEKIELRAEGVQLFTDEAFSVFDFDMYVVGSQSGVGSQIWKNNMLQEAMIDFSSNSFLNGIQIVENDIYVLGTNNNQIGVWKNQQLLPIELDLFPASFSKDISIEDGDISIVGNVVLNGIQRGALWQGNEPQALPVAFVGDANSKFNAYTKNNGISFIVGSTISDQNAIVWVDNTLFALPEGENNFSSATDIAIANNSTEYIVGTVSSIAVPEQPVVWINRELNVLPIPDILTDIEIKAVAADDNGNYYVVGHGFENGFSKAVIWKNGVFSFLSNTDDFSFANDVTVFRDDIYVVGRIGSQAVVWKNGEPTYLGEGEANAIAIAEK
ncbi:MAG: IPT/TIG domain-containing protein [Bacteroidota bacterium]